jgi:hypothetical protein
MKYIKTFEKFNDEETDIIIWPAKQEWVRINSTMKEKFLKLIRGEIDEITVGKNASHKFHITLEKPKPRSKKKESFLIFTTDEGLEHKMKVKDVLSKISE